MKTSENIKQNKKRVRDCMRQALLYAFFYSSAIFFRYETCTKKLLSIVRNQFYAL